MANIYDYLDQWGACSFAHKEINEVDLLILSWLSYVDWRGVVPQAGEEKTIPLQAAGEEYFRLHPERRNKKLARSILPWLSAACLLGRAMECPRFRELEICGFTEEMDPEAQKQFSAVTFLYQDWAAVVFRGTDTSFVGWEEDFRLALSDAVPAQLAAAAYPMDVPQLVGRKIYICGHSKGGNLAVYSAVKGAAAIRTGIEAVYSFDGPGFNAAFVQGEDYQSMLPRIFSYIPKASVVGLLLESQTEHKVIKSGHVSIMQHHAVYWKVEGSAFVRGKRVTLTSRLLDQTLKKWLAVLSEEEKKHLIQLIFSLLSATGAKRIEELTSQSLRRLIRAVRALNHLSWKEKRMLLRVIFRLIRAWNATLFRQIFLPGGKQDHRVRENG